MMSPEQTSGREVYCRGCDARHERPVTDHRGFCPNPTAKKFCQCGHRIEDCAPERCSHVYARDALWGNTR